MRTLRKTSIPLVIVPEGTTYAPLKRIVVAVAFEEMLYSTDLAILFWLVKQYDAAITVLHVERTDPDMNVAEVAGKLNMGRVLSNLNYNYEKVENNQIEQGILYYISNHPTDMLVMIVHQHSLLERVFGSIHTRSIFLESKTPAYAENLSRECHTLIHLHSIIN